MLLFRQSKYLSIIEKRKKELLIETTIYYAWTLIIWAAIIYWSFKLFHDVRKNIFQQQKTGAIHTEMVQRQTPQT